MKELPYMSPWE